MAKSRDRNFPTRLLMIDEIVDGPVPFKIGGILVLINSL